VPSPKKPQTLPIILSPEEVLHFLGCVASIKQRTILTTCYAAGLRISEAVHLMPSAIDRQRMVIRIEQGKGRKDRYVMLSPKLLQVLIDYWHAARPRGCLFPGDIPGQPITRGAVELACQAAHTRSGLTKPVTPHSLRHYLPCRTMSSSLDRNYKRLRNKENFRKNTRATRHSQRGLQAVQEPQQIVVGPKAG
jgi:integrase/recombinase XerD